MKLTGTRTIAADRETVWAALNDADVLKACIKGCQELEKTSDTSFEAVVKQKVGPVSATFKGAVELSDLNPPTSVPYFRNNDEASLFLRLRGHAMPEHD